MLAIGLRFRFCLSSRDPPLTCALVALAFRIDCLVESWSLDIAQRRQRNTAPLEFARRGNRHKSARTERRKHDIVIPGLVGGLYQRLPAFCSSVPRPPSLGFVPLLVERLHSHPGIVGDGEPRAIREARVFASHLLVRAGGP